MDQLTEQAIRRSAGFAYHLARIEQAVDLVEEMDALHFLPRLIRQQIALAEEMGAEDFERSRRHIRVGTTESTQTRGE